MLAKNKFLQQIPTQTRSSSQKRYVFEIRKRKLGEVMKLTLQAGIPGHAGGQGYELSPLPPATASHCGILQTLSSRHPNPLALALKIRGVRAQQCRQVSCPTVGNPITRSVVAFWLFQNSFSISLSFSMTRRRRLWEKRGRPAVCTVQTRTD